MDTKNKKTGQSAGVSSGPLRIHNDDGKLYVTGFGLWIPVDTEEEGLDLIRELEEQGYRLCH